jgi:hemerythrin superfamily protein
MADPFSMLEADHRQVEDFLSALEDSEEGPEREQLVAQLTEALQLHMQFEESSIYPLVVELLDEESAEEAEIEHQLARDGVVKLSELVSAPGFGAAVAMVQAGIQHHVEEEEGDMFPDLRQQVDDARQSNLLRQLVAAKQQAGLLTTSLERASKDDLLALAEGLGLEVKSSMTKDELSRLVESAAA